MQRCLPDYIGIIARCMKATGQEKYSNHNIFICSMSNIFHEYVPFDFVGTNFSLIKNPSYEYRPETISELKAYKLVNQVLIHTRTALKAIQFIKAEMIRK